jgi:hypothetical protein
LRNPAGVMPFSIRSEIVTSIICFVRGPDPTGTPKSTCGLLPMHFRTSCLLIDVP